MSSSSSSSRHHNHNDHHSHLNREEYDERESFSSDINGSNENLVHIKFLLPGPTTGSVIGKGGERIGSLQKETNTKMKMSKAGDYFPGSQERVCLVIGRIENILSVYQFLSEKIQETFGGDILRSRQIKLIIPNATAGVLIGKGGSTIENIKQNTTASLTITPKSDMTERVLTITGDDGVRIKALEIVLEKLLEDPHHDSITTVNYTNDNMYSFNHIQSFNDRSLNVKSHGSLSMSSSSNISLQLSGLERLSQLLINAGGTNHLTIDSLIHYLTSVGFVDPHIREIVQSISVLINNGLITIENRSRINPYSPNGHSMFPINSLSFERDYQENNSRNNIDMDSKRFKSDQQRTNKTKR